MQTVIRNHKKRKKVCSMNDAKRKKYSQITKQTVFSFATSILTLLIMILAMPILTRGLSLEEYGAYSIIYTTVLIMIVVLEFGFTSYFLTKFPGMRMEKERKTFFSITAFNSAIVLALLALAFVPFINAGIVSFLKLSEYQTEFNVGLLIIFFGVLFRLFVSKVQADRKIELANIASLLYNGLWLIALVAFFVIFKRIFLSEVIAIWLAGSLITLLVTMNFAFKPGTYLKTIKKAGKIKRFLGKIDFLEIKRALKFSLPLLFVMVAAWIIDALGKYFLNYFSNKESVAIFSFSYSIVGALLTLSAALVSTLYPYISETWHRKKNHHFLFNATLKYGLIVLLPSTIAILAMREQIITLIAGGKYLPASSIIVIMLPFPILSFLMNIRYYNLLLRERTKTIALVYLIGIIISITANIILVPKMGAEGAAIALVISFIAMYLMMLVICKTHFKWNFKFLNLWKIILASAIMGIIMALLNPQVLLTKLLTAIAGGIIYLALLWVMKVFTEEEIDFLKGLLRF